MGFRLDRNSGSGSSAGGLTQSQVDSRIAPYARINTDTDIPENLIPADITRDIEVPGLAGGGASGSSGGQGVHQWTNLTLFSSNALRPGLPEGVVFDGTSLVPQTGPWVTMPTANSTYMAIAPATRRSSETTWTIGTWARVSININFVQFNAGNNTPWHNNLASSDTQVRYRTPNGSWTLGMPFVQMVNFDWELIADVRIAGFHFNIDSLTERDLSQYEEFLIVAEFWNDTAVISQQSVILPTVKFRLLADGNFTSNNNLYRGQNAFFVVFDSQTFTRHGITQRTSWPVLRNEIARDVLAAARFNFASATGGTVDGYSNDTTLRFVRRIGQMHANNTIRIQVFVR